MYWIKAAGIVKHLLTLCFDEGVLFAGKTLFQKQREKRFRKKIEKWCEECFARYDGTILTSGSFIGVLENYNIISSVFNYTGETHAHLSDDKYIEKEINFIENCVGEQIQPLDRSILKDFLKKMLGFFRQYREKFLTENSKQIIQANNRNAEKIVDKIDDARNDILYKLENVQGPISTKDALDVFASLRNEYQQGNFSLLESIFPLFEGRNQDLEIWLSLILKMAFLEGDKYDKGFSVNDIKSIEIRNDAIRRVIAFKYFRNEIINASEFNAEGELHELVTKLSQDDSWLIDVTKTRDKGVDCYGIKFCEDFPDEKSLLTELQVISLSKRNYLGTYTIIEELLKKESNYLLLLLKYEKKYKENIASCDSEASFKAICQSFIDEIWDKRTIYSLMAADIQKMYWTIVLRSWTVLDSSKVVSIINQIPREVQTLIQDQIIVARIDAELISENEIRTYWDNKHDSRVLNYYFTAIGSEHATSIVESWGKESLENVDVFITYIELLRQDGKIDKASFLVREFEEKYSSYAEYWVEKVFSLDESDDVEKLEGLWLDGKLMYLSVLTEISIAHIMYEKQKFSTCIQIVEALEIKKIINPDLKRIKAYSMLRNGKVVEGVYLLNSLVRDYPEDQSLMANIMRFSISLHREVSDEVIQAAIDIGTSDMLMLVGGIYEHRKEYTYAEKCYIKAFLSCTNNQSKIYGVYWFFLIRHGKETSKCDVLEEKVYIKAHSLADNQNYTIAILPSDLIDDSYCLKNTLFVSVDIAIKNGWYGKKNNENILVEGKEYIITEVGHISRLFIQLCLDKMIQSGSVKVFSMPANSTPEQLRKGMISFLRQNTPKQLATGNVLNDYRNLKEIPVMLHSIAMAISMKNTQFLHNAFRDKTLLVREEIHYDNFHELIEEGDGLVLSFSSVVLLFDLGISIEDLKKINVYIPSSLVKLLEEEKNEIIIENKGDNTGRIGFSDEQLQVFKETDESRREIMKYAVTLFEFAKEIPQIENQKDLEVEHIDNGMLLEVFGIVDLDAISICKNNNYKLVTFEPLLSSLYLMVCKKNFALSILDLLNVMESDDIKLLSVMQKMLEFRLMNVIDVKSLERIFASTNEEISGRWNSYLETILSVDDDYKLWLRQHIPNISKLYFESRKEEEDFSINERERDFACTLMALLEREVHYQTDTIRDENGNLVLRTYMRVFDKKEQKYIEGLDQIIDGIITLQ